MADYYSVLKKTVAALPENTGAARRNIYQRARTAIVGQLKAYDPPLSPSEITNEQLRLEEAIRKVEAEAARETLGLNRPPEEPAAPGFARKPEEKSTASEASVPRPESAQSSMPVETPPVGESQAAQEAAPRPAAAENGRREPAFEGGAPAAGARAEPAMGDAPAVASPGGNGVKAEEKPAKAAASGKRKKDKQAVKRPPAHDRPSRIPVVMSIVVALLVLVGLAAIGYSQRDTLLALLEDSGEETRSTADVTPAATDDKADDKADDSGASSASNGKIDARLPTAGGSNDTAAAPDARTVTTTRISPAAPNGGTSAARQENVRTVEPGAAPSPSAPASSPAPSSADDTADAAAPQVNAPAAGTPAGPDAQSQDTASGSDAGSDDVRKVETASIAPDTGADAASGGNTPASAAVAQRSILYEEGPDSNGSGSASPGQAVWAFDSGSNGEDAVLRVDANITDRNIKAEVTIKPNTDDSLPASHLVEVQFEFPQELAGKGVANVPGLVMKRTEEARGDALIGASVKVADNLFWVALSNVPSERDRNMSLLRERGWIDIPILYEDGKRAILTLEKGTPGTRAVEQAMSSWQ